VTEEKRIKLIDRAETATVVAAAITLIGAGATAYVGKWELFGMIVGAATAYLFPKKKDRINSLFEAAPRKQRGCGLRGYCS
jgi:phosphopentomutase